MSTPTFAHAVQHWFRDRPLILATKHRKEQVMAPLLEAALGVKLRVPSEFDTDQFGTFTREIKRPGDQRVAARLKAEKALLLTGETLGIASEGSFGPHPAFPYIACDREIVLLLDQQHQLEVVGEVLATETNYSQQVIRSWTEAMEFATKVGFPEHGLVVMADLQGSDRSHIFKGITVLSDLEAAVTEVLQSNKGQAHMETDMRALYNPTRMKVIAQATQDLIQKLNQACPNCGAPGFRVVKRNPGLPCELCGLPTDLTRSVIYQCQKCSFQQEAPPAKGRSVADPTDCPYCNP
jgi:DNA-directed RNA polymerase subunit RPC12/RpoP